MQRPRHPRRWIAALGANRQSVHDRPDQRQGDNQQQPHPQAPGEEGPHAKRPFVAPAGSPALPASLRVNRSFVQPGAVVPITRPGSRRRDRTGPSWVADPVIGGNAPVTVSAYRGFRG